MSKSPADVVSVHKLAVRSMPTSSGNVTPFLSLELRKRARSSLRAATRRSRFGLSVAGVTSISSVTTGAPAMRAAAAPIRTNRTRWRSRAPRIFSGSGSGTTRPGCQRTKLPAGHQATSQPFRWAAAQLALDQELVVIAWIDPGESNTQLKTGGFEQGPQPLQAGNHLVAFVAADQRSRHSAPPTEFRLRDARSASGLDQQIPTYHRHQFNAKCVLIRTPEQVPRILGGELVWPPNTAL